MKIVLWTIIILFLLWLTPMVLVLIVSKVFNSPASHNAKPVNIALSNQFYFQKGSVVYVLGANFFNVGEKEINGADPETFEVLDQDYARDKNAVYYHDQAIPGLAPKGVRAVPDYENKPRDKTPPGSRYLAAQNAVYLTDELLPGADPQSFSALWGLYARDANTLYYWRDRAIPIRGEIAPLHPKQTKYLRMGEQLYFSGKALDADPQSFEFLPNQDSWQMDYTRDKSKVWNKGKLLEGVHAPSFRLLNSRYQIDRNHVYYYNRIIHGADPESFTLLSDQFSSDAKHIYFEDKIVVNANYADWNKAYAAKREKIWQWRPLNINDTEVLIVAADKVKEITNIFQEYDGKIFSFSGLLEGVSPQDIRVINSNYNNYCEIQGKIYYREKEILGADATSFEVLNGTFSRDAQRLYYNSYPVVDTHPNDFINQPGLYATENENGEYVLELDDNKFE